MIAFLLVTLAGVTPATATPMPQVAPDAPIDAPAYDPSVPAPRPGDITWDELEAMEATSSQFSALRLTATPSTNTEQVGTNAIIIRNPSGYWCDLVTGPIYQRKSGSGYTFGTVGAKPITTCNTTMRWIRHEATMYKDVWWGLQRVGIWGKTSYNSSGNTQTNIQVICADARSTRFRLHVQVTGMFPSGAIGGGGGAWMAGQWPCGTN